MELWQLLGIFFSTTIAGVICRVIYKISSNLASPVSRQLPGPKPASYLFGNVREFSVRGTPSLDLFEEWAEKYGGIFRYYLLFCEPRVVVTDPQILKHIYVTNWKNYWKSTPIGFSASVKFIGNEGLVFSNGELHKRHRKMINPVFRISNLKKFLIIFEDCAKKLTTLWLKNLEKHGKSEPILMPIKNDLSRVTLEIIGKAAFGFNFNCIERDSVLSETFAKLTSCKKPFRHIFRFLPFWENLPIPENLKACRERSLISRCVDSMIARKRELMANEVGRESIGKDLLGMMLLARDPDTGESLSCSELRDETMTFLAAGHETTSLGLSWTLLHLALHPLEQTKCREEILATLPESNITFEDIERLEYLNAAVQESLRLRTPAPASLRQTMKDDFLGDYYVPMGTKVLTLHGVMQRLPNNWNCPLAYDPSRFLDQKADVSDAYMPFGAGPRKCIGYKFAVLELTTVLAILLRQFEFLPHPTVEYKSHMLFTQSPYPNLELLVRKHG
ncbi:hypothetical protein M514_00551 [Trichuris suis]|uniref:Unspecific monooxygenase n=1 Tax=Trichuris suis TaxID=68888 RepID=A0A085MM79_9BILA|nr:hypothetical protein M513_00551 [Trichuris suis]KFD67464.1 hypothetical protein M514_00551 [Trichuris suis]